VLWFFVFAYAITGVGMCVLYLFLARRLPGWTWLPYGPYLTGTGPSLAALLMILWLYGLPGIRRLAFQLSPLSVGGAWLVLAVCLLPRLVPPSLVVLASLVGLLMVPWLRRLAGVRRLAFQLRPWLLGQGWPVLAVCLLLPLGIQVLRVNVLAMLGFAVPPLSLGDYLYGAVIGQGFIGSGLFEEIGWRGFALPQLQRRYSALVSSLIIGVVWGFWHVQNYMSLNPFPVFMDPFPWLELTGLVLTGGMISVIYTWVYNSTEGSLFAVVVLHGATIASGKLFSWHDLPQQSATAQRWLGLLVLLPYLVIAVGLVWRYGAANLSWRDRVVAEPPNPAPHLTPAATSGSGRS
jgi:membrane protease YdiL (CAAX protease family)